MNFKKLTTEEDKDVYVNIELATEIRIAEKGNVTNIYFDCENVTTVKETPEEIFKLPKIYINCL